jgi:hypothetical protein
MDTLADILMIGSLLGIAFILGKVFERNLQKRRDLLAEVKAYTLYRAGTKQR